MTETPNTAFQTVEVLNMHKPQIHTHTHTSSPKGSNMDTFHVTKYLKIIINIHGFLYTHTHSLLHNVTVPIGSVRILPKVMSLHLKVYTHTHKKKIQRNKENKIDRQKERLIFGTTKRFISNSRTLEKYSTGCIFVYVFK